MFDVKYNFDKDGKAMYVQYLPFMCMFILLQFLPGNELCWGYAYAFFIIDIWISLKMWAKAMRKETADKKSKEDGA